MKLNRIPILILFLKSITTSLSSPPTPEPPQSSSQCTLESSTKLKVILETPLYTTNSYAIVGTFVAMALSNRSDVDLKIIKLANFNPEWKDDKTLFPDEIYGILDGAVISDSDVSGVKGVDVTIRVGIDFDAAQVPSKATAVMATAERFLSAAAISGSTSPVTNPHNHLIIVPSNWSYTGMILAGINEDNVTVIPHGVDTSIFKPLPSLPLNTHNETPRDELRRLYNCSNSFVFYSISAMTDNKNVGLILEAFVELSSRFGNVKLILKGNDELYDSQSLLNSLAFPTLTTAQVEQLNELYVSDSIIYIGKSLPFTSINQLHQLSDVYISPYKYEGFNLPVLEAMAAGNPVIVTKGGSTDDFVSDLFGYKVEAEVVRTKGVQRVNANLEDVEVGVFRIDGHDGVYINSDVRELDVDKKSLMEQMVKAVVERREFELTKEKRIEIIKEAYSWERVAERILDELVGIRKAP